MELPNPGTDGDNRDYHCDLVIYTLKGILIVNVKFDSDLWNEILQKLRNLFVEYILRNYSIMTYLSHYRVIAVRC